MRAITNTEDFDTDLSETLVGESELVGDGFGDIEHATTDERTAVVHADLGGFSVLEIGHADDAGKRKGFVGSAAGPRPELFANGGFAGKDQEMLTVVGSHAGFDMPDGLARMHRLVANAAQSIGLVFVTVVGGGAAAKEERSKQQES